MKPTWSESDGLHRLQEAADLYHYFQERRKAPTVTKILEREGLHTTRQGVADFLTMLESGAARCQI